MSARPLVSSFAKRVLWRLEEAESSEANPHYQDDYRIAWIAVLAAASGVAQPFVVATYQVLGLHPDRVWPAIVARRRALLGSYYEAFWGATAADTSLPPKKPPQPVREIAARKEAA